MKTIFGLIVFGIVSASLLVWLLVLGFQTQSLVDVFTIDTTFVHWSASDILFMFPLIMLVPFIFMALSIILKF